MKILITGAKGFIGKNLIAELENRGYTDILKYDIDSEPALLDKFCKECEFVFNLAGVNRPEREEDFMRGNYCFAMRLLDTLRANNNKCPVMLSSSIQADLDNSYGRSKKAGEELFIQYSNDIGAKVLIYRFPNVFGKWCRPNYNSVIATFCNNIAKGLPITVNDRKTLLKLVYIDDLVAELISALEGYPNVDDSGYCYVPVVYHETLGEIVDLLYSFKTSRKTLAIPYTGDGSFEKKLYATYLSYLPQNDFVYDLKMNIDERGSFTEILKSNERGQFSVNITKPGITKGNHWHHTKNEKFVVVAGHGKIQFRKIDSAEIITYVVSGEKIQVVDIPPGYTHCITNIGDTELITFMWCNECYDPNKADTYYLKVQEDNI